MPNYEYKCEQCGKVFEKRQRFADEPLKTHSECGGPVHRLLSAPALQFKGTGWYVTDYAKSSTSSPASSSNGGKSDASKGENSTSESGSKKDSTATSSTPAASETKSS